MRKHRRCSNLNAVNSSLPWHNGRHFADDIFRCIFINEKFNIFIRISPKFVPKGSIADKLPLVQVMAWRRAGGKPLPEPMLAKQLTYICGTRGDELI